MDPVASMLDGLGAHLRAELGPNLVGLYVYGSLTQQAYDPHRSDIDCVAVTRRHLTLNGACKLRVTLRQLGRSYPLSRRLQLTILIQHELLQFDGDGWLSQFGRLTRTGSDGNPIIWANILDTGLVILGPDPHSFVPPITPQAMRAALETGRVVSKDTAAEWALRRLPGVHHPTIRRAVAQLQRAGPIQLGPLRALLSYVEARLARRSRPMPAHRRLTLTTRGD